MLDGVDLTVPGGTALAVVGRSGSGKSLLAELAGRLTDPDTGEVLLDGVPLPALRHDDLRRAVTYAFARPALLGTTVEDTVALGLAAPLPRRDPGRRPQGPGPTRTSAACPTATRPASPTPRAPAASPSVSGLARAFAHPGRLLILDDALSSLDTVTEHHITGVPVVRPRPDPPDRRPPRDHGGPDRRGGMAGRGGGSGRWGTHAELWRDAEGTGRCSGTWGRRRTQASSPRPPRRHPTRAGTRQPPGRRRPMTCPGPAATDRRTR